MNNENAFSIFFLTPNELLLYMQDNYIVEIPLLINSVDDLIEVGTMLSTVSNQYSYMSALLSFAKIMVRETKRKGKDFKIEYEDMVDKKEIIQNTLDSLKLRYQSLSRLITIKQEVNAELHMSDCR